MIQEADVGNKWVDEYENEKNDIFFTFILIHSADPQSRPVVIIVSAHVVRTYVRLHFSKSSKTKQISSENNDHYGRDCGSARVYLFFHVYIIFHFEHFIVRTYHVQILLLLFLSPWNFQKFLMMDKENPLYKADWWDPRNS